MPRNLCVGAYLNTRSRLTNLTGGWEVFVGFVILRTLPYAGLTKRYQAVGNSWLHAMLALAPFSLGTPGEKGWG